MGAGEYRPGLVGRISAGRVNQGDQITPPPPLRVGLLTGGEDRSYAIGLTSALVARGVQVDFVGSDKTDGPELHGVDGIDFLNLRGDQRENVHLLQKADRLLTYYVRLAKYAVVARPRIFHVLWNNKFELFDRTLLMLYYRLVGRTVVLTAHNVNAAKRDSRDGAMNRWSLRTQYRLARHIFVHTELMREELKSDFAIPEAKISVIPFGINNTSPVTPLTADEAKQRLGLKAATKTMLFFGQIAPYKGLEYLVAALAELTHAQKDLRLIIAGKVKKGSEAYWRDIEHQLDSQSIGDYVIRRITHIPDAEVELLFKAADVLVVPYTRIFQSGVPFLAYSFGLPVIATDVGSLRYDVVEDRTGLLCKPRDPADLARSIRKYFSSELFQNLANTRSEVRGFANERHSWAKVAEITEDIYRRLLVGNQAMS